MCRQKSLPSEKWWSVSNLSPLPAGSLSPSSGGKSSEDPAPSRAELIGDSPVFRRAIEEADRFAVSDLPVLITGETGTGKELLAKRIHLKSRRSAGPFRVLNCARPEDSFFDDELFGHEKGSFTGADSARDGLIAAAHGGTLVLDEINSLTPRAQGKLLRVLEDQQVRRIGANTKSLVDVRFIAVTNACLETMVENRSFREDLYSRLSEVEVHLPPLRERPEDILPLARFFLSRIRLPGGGIAKLTPEAEEALRSCRWPRNVRQLDRTLTRAVLLCSGGLITPVDLNLPLNGNNFKQCCLPYAEAKSEFDRDYFGHVCKCHGESLSEAARWTRLDRSTVRSHLKEFNLTLGTETPGDPGELPPGGDSGDTSRVKFPFHDN